MSFRSMIADEKIYYIHTDHLGAPLVLTDSTGVVAWKAFYTAFGATQIIAERVENPLRLPGQCYDLETGLHYNYFRYYHPKIGRYLTPDPLGLEAGTNLYAYVGGNPVNFIDPFGWWGFGLTGGASAGIGLAAGAIGTVSVGAGVFGGKGLNAGVFLAGGGLAGVKGYGPRYPDPSGSSDGSTGYIFGYGASAGAGLFGTNAKSVCELKGPFKTISISGGLFFGGELTVAWSNGTYFVSLTGTVSPLPWLSAMVSLISTNTAVRPLAGRNCGCN